MTPTGEAAASPAWARARREHRDALAALLDTIEAVDPDAWGRPRAEGAWSPAQIAEHLALVYEAISRDLTGAGSLRPRVPPWQQRLLRWFLLPHILFHGSVPLRARAPREVAPSDTGLPQPDAPGRLTALADRMEADLDATRDLDRCLTHPYFGRIDPLKALRFCAVHLQHHRRQLLSVPQR